MKHWSSARVVPLLSFNPVRSQEGRNTKIIHFLVASKGARTFNSFRGRPRVKLLVNSTERRELECAILFLVLVWQ